MAILPKKLRTIDRREKRQMTTRLLRASFTIARMPLQKEDGVNRVPEHCCSVLRLRGRGGPRQGDAELAGGARVD